MSDEILFCPDCGTRQPKAGAKFCLKCGAALGAPAAAPQPAAAVARRTFPLWIIPVFLLAGMLVAALAWATAWDKPGAQRMTSATPIVAAAGQGMAGATSVPASDATAVGAIHTAVPTTQSTATPRPTANAAADVEAAAAERMAAAARDISDIVQLAPHELRRIGRGSLNDVALSPKGDVLAVATGLGAWLYRLDAPDDQGRLLPSDSMATAVSWSPDGARLAVMGFDGVARIWEPDSGLVESSMGHCQGHYPTDMEWSPDGKRIAAYCGDGADVFDSQSGEWLGKCAYPVSSAEFTWSPDGAYLGAIVSDKEQPREQRLDICRGDTGKFERTAFFPGDNERIMSAAWSPDGKQIAIALYRRELGANGEYPSFVKLIDAASGQLIYEIAPGGAANIAWSPDGRYLALDQRQRIALIEASTAQMVDSIDTSDRGPGSAASLSWSANGAVLVNGSDNGTVYLWDVASRSLAKTLRGHNHLMRAFPWLGDGRRVAAVDAYKAIDEWDASSGQPLAQHPVTDAWALSPEWSRAVTSNWRTRRLQVRAVRDGSVICELPEAAGDDGYNATWSPDGKWISTLTDEKTLRLWHGADCTPAGETKAYARMETVHWSPDGKNLAYVLDDKTIISTIPEGLGNAMPWSANLEFYITDIAWAPDKSKIAAIGNRELWISKLGYRYPEVILNVPLDVGDAAALTLAWSPDGSRFAVGTSHGRILVFSASTGQRLLSLQGHNMWGPDVWWSPDSRQLLSNAGDGTLRIWDVSETASLVPVTEPPASPTLLPASIRTPEPASVSDSTPAPAAAAGDSLAGQIVFLSNRDYPANEHPNLGPFDIYVMNPDGSNQRALTRGREISNLGAPIVSPDGSQIIYAGRGGQATIIGANGAVQRTFSTPTQQGFMLDWSKTGKVLYAGYPGTNGPDLYSIDVESGNATRLTNDDISQMFATWSPDGSQIAYMHDYFLWMMNADGSGKRQLVEGEARDMDWSPDGRQIVFESLDVPKSGVEYDLRIVNSDGTGKRLLADTPGTPLMAPSWSPDGQQIAFEAWFDPPKGDPQIMVLNVASGEMKQLTTGGYNTRAFWVADDSVRR